MRQYIDTLQDAQGNALVGATVLVQNYQGGANASIFSDNGLTPILTSTVITGVDGQFSFFAADGDYNLVMSKNATVFKTQSPVSIFDGAAQVTYPDVGTLNAIATSNNALEKALRTGLRCWVTVANTITGAATLAYNGLAAKSIVNPGGAALTAGLLVATGIYGFEYNGTAWQLSQEGATNPITQSATNFFYQNQGANIQRLNDRVFIGGATVNDGNTPNVTQDWLTAFQTGLGIPFGSIQSAEAAILTTTAQDAVTASLGLVIAARGFNANQNGQNFIALETYALNNSPNFTNSVWAHYTEAHRLNNVVGTAIGHEIDNTQHGALVGINPYIQNFGQTIGMQFASGAQQGALATASFATNVMTISLINEPSDTGLIQVGWRVKGVGISSTIASFGSGTGGTGTYNLSTSPGTVTSRLVAISPMFDNTAAINIQANPNSYATGINFGANAIAGTDGTNGVPSPAIQMARFQGLFWFAGATTGTGQIYCDASATAGAPSIELASAAVNFSEVSSGGRNFQVGLITNAVNYSFAEGAVTGGSPAIGALGGDTNVDLSVFCAGTGLLKFTGASMISANGSVATVLGSVGPTGAHTTVQEWLTYKNSAGTIRWVPAF